MLKCSQTECEKLAFYRYTWPGQDEAFCCEEHAQKVRGVANALGMHIQLIPLYVLDGDDLPGKI